MLWRLKYAYDPTSYKNAVLLLSRKAQLVHPVGRRLTELVIHEWLNPNCPVCIGAKEIVVNDLKIVCAECNGLGLKKYEDKFRDQFLGTRFAPWAKHYGLIQAILGKNEIRVNVRMNVELETLEVVK